jgi:hypothetical protein
MTIDLYLAIDFPQCSHGKPSLISNRRLRINTVPNAAITRSMTGTTAINSAATSPNLLAAVDATLLEKGM